MEREKEDNTGQFNRLYTLKEHRSYLADYQYLLNKVLPEIDKLTEKVSNGPSDVIEKFDIDHNTQFKAKIVRVSNNTAYLYIFSPDFDEEIVKIQYNAQNRVVDSAVFVESVYTGKGHIQAWCNHEISAIKTAILSPGKWKVAK